jgi:hypothetical protein
VRSQAVGNRAQLFAQGRGSASLFEHVDIRYCRNANGSGRLRIPPPADAVMCSLDAGILIAHQLVDSRGEFRFQRTFITVFCTVFSLLNTTQQRVISCSEIIFEFEPRSVKHSRTAPARVGVRLSKPPDDICEFHSEARTFQALLLEILFRSESRARPAACRYPVSPSRQVSISFLKYVSGIIRHCFSLSHDEDDSDVRGAVSTLKESRGTRRLSADPK